RSGAAAVESTCYSTMIASSLVQVIVPETGSANIASAVELEIVGGRLLPGTRLPPVPSLASALHVGPATVASAYRTLPQRGSAAWWSPTGDEGRWSLRYLPYE